MAPAPCADTESPSAESSERRGLQRAPHDSSSTEHAVTAVSLPLPARGQGFGVQTSSCLPRPVHTVGAGCAGARGRVGPPPAATLHLPLAPAQSLLPSQRGTKFPPQHVKPGEWSGGHRVSRPIASSRSATRGTWVREGGGTVSVGRPKNGLGRVTGRCTSVAIHLTKASAHVLVGRRLRGAIPLSLPRVPPASGIVTSRKRHQRSRRDIPR